MKDMIGVLDDGCADLEFFIPDRKNLHLIFVRVE